MLNIFVENNMQDRTGEAYRPTRKNKKCDYISSDESTEKCQFAPTEVSCQMLSCIFKEQKPKRTFFGGDDTHSFSKKTSLHYLEGKLHLLFRRHFSTNEIESWPKLSWRRQKPLDLKSKGVQFPLGWRN